MGREDKMKRLAMLAVLLSAALSLSGCFFFLGAEPEVEYVMTTLVPQTVTITYMDDNSELRESTVFTEYFQTDFTVPATDKFLAFVQAEGSLGGTDITVRIYVDGSLKRSTSGTADPPVASAAYLIEP
jgi:hypothetical protein